MTAQRLDARMYTSPDSALFWLSRSVFISLIVSALWLEGVGTGEYGLLHPVSPFLLPLSIAGLVAFELGIWLGLTRGRAPAPEPRRDEAAVVPLLLWLVSSAAVLLLFQQKGIPLFTDPDRRATVGEGVWVLKRLATVWFPLASVELFMLAGEGRSAGARLLAWPIVLLTLAVLVLVTAKAPILLFLVLLFLVDWHRRATATRNSWWRAAPLLLGLVGLVVIASIAYARFATNAPFFALMGFRLTTMVANMPNYILLGLAGVPTAGELLWHDLWSILSTIHVPFVPPPPVLETQLSEHVLGRFVEMGGMSPTVVGEGWILGGLPGVLLLSGGFGALAGRFVRTARISRTATTVAFAYFAAFVVYYPMQFFAVGAFLDWGLSLIAYRVGHALLTSAVRGLEPPGKTSTGTERAVSR